MIIINNGTARIEIMTSEVESDISDSTTIDEGPSKDTSFGVVGTSTDGREGMFEGMEDSPLFKKKRKK